jgi:hypothetical protein
LRVVEIADALHLADERPKALIESGQASLPTCQGGSAEHLSVAGAQKACRQSRDLVTSLRLFPHHMLGPVRMFRSRTVRDDKDLQVTVLRGSAAAPSPGPHPAIRRWTRRSGE